MTNELKCPVCGEGMFKTIPHDDGEIVYSCGNHDISEIMYQAIQLRIDKEKAAAVQQERERIDDEYTERIEELEALLRDWKERCQCD